MHEGVRSYTAPYIVQAITTGMELAAMNVVLKFLQQMEDTPTYGLGVMLLPVSFYITCT